jgi:hypothetical protein
MDTSSDLHGKKGLVKRRMSGMGWVRVKNPREGWACTWSSVYLALCFAMQDRLRLFTTSVAQQKIFHE